MSQSHRETLESIKYTRGSLRLLDQRRLPLETVFDDITSVQDIWVAIREMRVRGAPAIAVSAALGLAVATQREFQAHPSLTVGDLISFILKQCDYLITSRPTAVNLANTLCALKAELQAGDPSSFSTPQAVVDRFTEMAEQVFKEDVAYNEGIMRHGAAHILRRVPSGKRVSVLTICNTGALATSRYGTALGVVRQLFYDNRLEQVYACETRPWNQGARLTVYECVEESIPCTLICDSAVSALLSRNEIHAVVVGADRICQNGDTANKIGTYHLAVAAKHHGVPFYVAAPSTTLDGATLEGSAVAIEEREPSEITTNAVTGQRVVADGPRVRVWNPVFDITPASLITGGIITEAGVFEPAPASPHFNIKNILEVCAKK